jgi:hypothetical protein
LNVGRDEVAHVGSELAEKMSNPLIFQWKAAGAKKVYGSKTVHGYDVTILIDVCKAIILAAEAGALLKRNQHIVKQAHVILNASAS